MRNNHFHACHFIWCDVLQVQPQTGELCIYQGKKALGVISFSTPSTVYIFIPKNKQGSEQDSEGHCILEENVYNVYSFYTHL